jgi:antitoxin HigA-1
MHKAMKRTPTHPGELLKYDVLPSMGVTQEKFAKMLGLSRKTVNEILAARSPVSAETAVKLGALLDNTPQFWMNLQSSYDLWQASNLIGQDTLQQLEALHRQFASR